MKRLASAFAAELSRSSCSSAHRAAQFLDSLDHALPVGLETGPTPKHLADALAASQTHPLAARLAEVAAEIPWVQVSGHTMPPSIAGRYAYCDIVGPDALVRSDDICFGAYLQYPDTWYPMHWHAAEELYFPISGTALWSRDGVAGEPVPPGQLIRHASYERHAMRTGTAPMLALWVWLGNLDFSTYGIDLK